MKSSIYFILLLFPLSSLSQNWTQNNLINETIQIKSNSKISVFINSGFNATKTNISFRNDQQNYYDSGDTTFALSYYIGVGLKFYISDVSAISVGFSNQKTKIKRTYNNIIAEFKSERTENYYYNYIPIVYEHKIIINDKFSFVAKSGLSTILYKEGDLCYNVRETSFNGSHNGYDQDYRHDGDVFKVDLGVNLGIGATYKLTKHIFLTSDFSTFAGFLIENPPYYSLKERPKYELKGKNYLPIQFNLSIEYLL